jgi:hypothetical protein
MVNAPTERDGRNACRAWEFSEDGGNACRAWEFSEPAMIER